MLEECFCRGCNENCAWCHGSGRKKVQLAPPVYAPFPRTHGNKGAAQIQCGFCREWVADLAGHTQQKHPGHRPASWKAASRGTKTRSSRQAQPGTGVSTTPKQVKTGTRSKGRASLSITQIYEAMRERERAAAEEKRLEREARTRATVRATPPPTSTQAAKAPAPAQSKPPKKVKFQGPIVCPDCTRQFADLRAHLVAEHGWTRNAVSGSLVPPTDRKRTVPCPCCRTTSIRRDRLDRHLTRQHGIGAEAAAPDRVRPSPTRPAKARAAAQAASATLIIHRGKPGDAASRKPAAPAAAGPGQKKKKKRKSGAKAGTSSTRRASSGERKAYRSPVSQESGNPFQQERHERLSDATRGLGYARRESGHWGSTVAFDDYGDESNA